MALDRSEFQQLKDLKAKLIPAAMEEIANRVTSIREQIQEIREIAKMAEIEHLELDSLYYAADEIRDEFRDWNSSSC